MNQIFRLPLQASMAGVDFQKRAEGSTSSRHISTTAWSSETNEPILEAAELGLQHKFHFSRPRKNLKNLKKQFQKSEKSQKSLKKQFQNLRKIMKILKKNPKNLEPYVNH